MRACFLARVTKRLIIEDGMNYRAWTRKKKKKKKERTVNLFPFRHRISGFCCSALSAHTKRVGRVYRGYSLVRNRRIEIENRRREPNSMCVRFASIRCKSKGDIRVDERSGSQRVLETRWFFLQIIPLENNRINVRPSLFSRTHHHKSKFLIFETWHRCHYF